jgi:hypothetical protein
MEQMEAEFFSIPQHWPVFLTPYPWALIAPHPWALFLTPHPWPLLLTPHPWPLSRWERGAWLNQ